MPNSRLTGSTTHEEGVIVLGDALNMRHPLTGGKCRPLDKWPSRGDEANRLRIGGMTVAFNDVLLLRSLLAKDVLPDLWDDQAVRVCMATFHRRRKAHACVLNVLAHGIYTIFAADPGKYTRLK